jgi:hypothetical protein
MGHMPLQVTLQKKNLNLGYNNSAFRTNLYAGLTAQALIRLGNDRFAIITLFINSGRASVDAFLVCSAFVKINSNFPHNPSSIFLIKKFRNSMLLIL